MNLFTRYFPDCRRDLLRDVAAFQRIGIPLLAAPISRICSSQDLVLVRSYCCLKEGHLYFFSSPQSLNLAENSVLTVDYQMKIPFNALAFEFERRCSSLRGLIFLRDTTRNVRGRDYPMSVICDLSTGRSMTLPELKTRKRIGMKSYLGYDPIEKQHKVLSMTWKMYGPRQCDSEEHQVLTLGTRDLSWRMIECFIPHTPNPNYSHICINGVLYYSAKLEISTYKFMIVCFDVRSEKFSFVDNTTMCSSLINYNGKLGSLEFRYICGSCSSIKLKILEDVDKKEWLEYIYEMPALWRKIVGGSTFRFTGVTRNNEIVFYGTEPFYILYYNTERKSIKRVEIQGMEGFKGYPVYTFQDHIEDLKLLML